MAKLISKTYGEALFELAVEEDHIDEWMKEVEGVRKVLKDNGEFGDLMKHPKITKEEKLQIIENVFKGRISDELLGFLTLIVNKGRYPEVDSILDFFIGKVKEKKGIGVAYVRTAVALTEIQKKQVEERLLETTSYHQIELHFTISADIIGGMVIRIGDRVVDSSISTKLDELRKLLLKVQLA